MNVYYLLEVINKDKKWIQLHTQNLILDIKFLSATPYKKGIDRFSQQKCGVKLPVNASSSY